MQTARKLHLTDSERENLLAAYEILRKQESVPVGMFFSSNKDTGQTEWCGIGALAPAFEDVIAEKTKRKWCNSPERDILEKAAKAHGFASFYELNDTQGLPAVLKLYEEILDIDEWVNQPA